MTVEFQIQIKMPDGEATRTEWTKFMAPYRIELAVDEPLPKGALVVIHVRTFRLK